MSTVADRQRSSPNAPPAGPAGLAVSAYDRVASMLISLLMMVGLVVGCLLMVWLSSQIFSGPRIVPVVLEDFGEGGGGGAGTNSPVMGEGMEMDTPTVQDFVGESDFVESDLTQTLTAITESVAPVVADVEASALADPVERGGGGGGFGRSRGTGGSIGPGFGYGEPGIPRAQRWRIFFQEGNSLEGYARQLDFFKIEIGVVGGGSQVLYVYNLAKPKPDVRSGPGASEQRVYFSWQSGTLKDADLELAARGGVSTGGRRVVLFYPDAVIARLLMLEQEYGKRKPSEIRQTRFGVKSVSGGYEFYVIDQTYL